MTDISSFKRGRSESVGNALLPVGATETVSITHYTVAARSECNKIGFRRELARLSVHFCFPRVDFSVTAGPSRFLKAEVGTEMLIPPLDIS